MPNRIHRREIRFSWIEWKEFLVRLREFDRATTVGELHQEQLSLRAWLEDMLQEAYEMGREDARND